MTEATVIRGGTVVDGTGAAPRTADVLIHDGCITEIGRVDCAGARDVDADGLLVTPGWVDVHTHYDGQIFWDPLVTPSSWHGATTVVTGSCGVGFAPVRSDDHEQLIALMQSIEDIPAETLRAGLPWGWESFAEFIAAVDRTPRAIDVGVLVPHGAVRNYLMGERGERGEATPEEIEAIASMMGDAVAAGALGASGNRTLLKAGLVPGSFASDEELIAIAKAVGVHGGLFQTNPASVYGPEEWTPLDDELDLMRRMSLAGRMPLTFSLVQDNQAPDRWRYIMERVSAANAEGARLVPQVLARPMNAIMTLAGNHPLLPLPQFKAQAAGLASTAALASRLREPAIREAILAEARPALAKAWIFDAMHRITDPPNYEPDAAHSVGAEARRQGLEPVDLFYDMLTAGAGDAMFLAVVGNYGNGNSDDVLEMILHPETILGLGDGGAHCLGLCDATTPTTLLTQFVRDRKRGERLPVEIAVRELTSGPARAFGLHDRGILAPGRRADINIIDLDRLRMGTPEFVHDLPANGKRLIQRATGYAATFVKGEQILAEGADTGARPGRAVRKQPVREVA